MLGVFARSVHSGLFPEMLLFGSEIMQLIVVLDDELLLVVEQCPISLCVQAVIAATGLHARQELSILVLL